jgi:hypothetical protein
MPFPAIRSVLTAAMLLAAAPASANLIANGGFEAGDTGFTSGYTSIATPGSPPTLIAPATYAILNNPNLFHPAFGGAPQAGNLFMAVNGADVAGVTVWESAVAIPVTPNTTYYFGAWVSSLFPASPAQLAFSINGVQVGSSFSPSATVGLWSQFYEAWDSGSSTLATISIVNLNTAFNGNDFGLDSLTFGTEVPAPEPASLALLGMGLLGLGAARLRRRAG